MTDEQRIEAVAKMVCPNGINDACKRAGVCKCCREIAEHYLRAGYPELFSDKPTAVIVSAYDVAHADELLVRKVLTFEQAETLLAARIAHLAKDQKETA